MTVSLTKGSNVSLTKEAGGSLAKLTIGLGWDPRSTTGADYDLDAIALGLGADRQVVNDQYMVFYGNKQSPGGHISHGGDNLTGAGDGDDETITLDLASMPAEIQEVLFVVSIYDAASRNNQNFGDVSNAYMRALDANTSKELARFDLTEDGGGLTCVVFGSVYRDKSGNGEWKMKAIEQGYSEGLAGLARSHGVNVG